MTLNPSTMRLGIASILVGLVGAYGVRHMMEEDEAPPEEKKEQMVQVPLASGNLPVGRVIRKGDIGLAAMTGPQMDERGWNRGEMMMNPDQIIGRELKRPLAAGSPFLTSEVYLEGMGQLLDVKKGMRKVQVRIGEDRGGLNAYRGDTVDLYFTSEPQGARDGKPAIPEKTINVVEAVRILNVDYPDPDRRWSDEDTPIFSLEVDPVTAGKVTTLKDYGDFAVVVRASDEPVGRSKGEGEFSVADLLGIEEPVPPPEPQFVSVEYWHGGRRSYKHFPMPQLPTEDQLAQQQPRTPIAEPVADVLPGAPTPTPAARQRPEPTPIPYRPDPSPSVLPPTPPTPSFEPPAPTGVGSGSTDPFTDDPEPSLDVGEVLP